MAQTAGSKIPSGHDTQGQADHSSGRVEHSSGLRSDSERSTETGLHEGSHQKTKVQGTSIRGDIWAAQQAQGSVTLRTNLVNTPRATALSRQAEVLQIDRSNSPGTQLMSIDDKVRLNRMKNDESATSGTGGSTSEAGKETIGKASWEQVKAALKNHYLGQDMSLPQLMKIMSEKYGFHATKSQYERQFKKWAFRKNISKSDWTQITHKINKRKLMGKESVVCIDNVVIPAKKIKKEAARYGISFTEAMRLPSTSPPPPDGVTISTPPTSPYYSPSTISCRTSFSGNSLPFNLSFINIDDLPWFRYQRFLDSAGISFSTFVAENPTMGVKSMLASGNVSVLDPITVENVLWTMTNILSKSKVFSMHLGPNERPNNTQENLDAIYSYLQAVMVERNHGEHLATVQKIFASATGNGVFLYISLIVYLSSNNLISDETAYRAVSWATANNSHNFLKAILSIRTPTAKAFAENIFRYSLDAEDLEIVQLGLDGGINPNIQLGPLRLLPLQLAAKKKNFELVRILLRAGAEPNAFASISENSAVTEVASKEGQMTGTLLGHEEALAIQLLTECEKRPLQSAIEGGNFEIVRLLLNAGADVNSSPASNAGRTALQAAAEGGNLEIVRLLLDAGADVNSSPASNAGRTALQAAAEGGNLEIVRLLLDAGADVNSSPASNAGRTALQAAAEGGNLEIVRLLLDAGADVNSSPASNAGRTALQAAAEGGNLEIVRLLLDAGADVNSSPASNAGRTALQAAAEGGNLEIVRLLLDAGADVNSSPASNAGRTALQAAAEGGNLEIVRLLLDAGADVNSSPASNAGRTALQAAAEGGNLEIVRLLLDAGADVNSSPALIAGKMALQAAVENGNFELIRLFLETAGVGVLNSTSIETALEAAALQGYVGMAYRILEVAATSKIWISDVCWKISLAGAAGNGRIDMVQLLCNWGAEIYGKTDGLFSEALQMAERNGHYAVFQLIKQHLHGQ